MTTVSLADKQVNGPIRTQRDTSYGTMCTHTNICREVLFLSFFFQNVLTNCAHGTVKGEEWHIVTTERISSTSPNDAFAQSHTAELTSRRRAQSPEVDCGLRLYIRAFVWKRNM